jgi:hypothetical protein
MRLEEAALFFDDTPVYDGYTGEFLWKCQFSSFNDANAIGSTSTRRTLSIAPGLQIPTRRVLLIHDARWLVGDGNPDSWKGEVIRQGYNMKKATALAEILTPAQACLGSAGTPAYCQLIYFKDTVTPLNDADNDPYWNIFLAPGESVARGTFFRIGGKLYRARSAYLPLENLRIAGSDEVDIGPVAASFGTGTYVPATDSFAGGAVSTQVLMFDFNKAYAYLTKASERVASGDMSALVPVSALSPAITSRVTISGVVWQVLSKVLEGDAWLVHLRRA